MSFKHLNMSSNYKSVNNLKVSEDLLSFVDNELLKDSEISPEKFWSGLSEALHDLAPKNNGHEGLRDALKLWHEI